MAARVAHNHEVAGSSPVPATKTSTRPKRRVFVLVPATRSEPATKILQGKIFKSQNSVVRGADVHCPVPAKYF